MPFMDVALFGLVMILMGVLLAASCLALGLIVSMFSRKTSSRERESKS